MKYKVLIFFVSVSIRQAIDCRRSELVTYISCCCLLAYRSSHPEVFCKKGILRNFAKFTGKNLSQTLAQVFSCEFCQISKNTFYTEHPWTTASKTCVKANKVTNQNLKLGVLVIFRGGSRGAATSKMEDFVIIVNGR